MCGLQDVDVGVAEGVAVAADKHCCPCQHFISVWHKLLLRFARFSLGL